MANKQKREEKKKRKKEEKKKTYVWWKRRGKTNKLSAAPSVCDQNTVNFKVPTTFFIVNSFEALLCTLHEQSNAAKLLTETSNLGGS